MIVFGDIAIVVSDAKATAKWWKDKCGFDIRDNEGHWVTVAAPGSPVLMHLCQNGSHEEGNTGIGFEVGDVEATEAAWSARGVKFTKPTTRTQWGAYAMFADPDGNEFWLNEDPELRPKPKAKAKAKPKAKAPAKKSAKKAKASKKR